VLAHPQQHAPLGGAPAPCRSRAHTLR
jgi:hypothetical protein